MRMDTGDDHHLPPEAKKKFLLWQKRANAVGTYRALEHSLCHW